MKARFRCAACALSALLALCFGANCQSRTTTSAAVTSDVTPANHAADIGSGTPASHRRVSELPFEPPAADGWGRVEGLAYWEVVLGGVHADEALPLLLLLHGMGDAPGPHWPQTVHVRGKVRLVMPRAPRPYGGGFSWFDYRVADNEPVALGHDIAAEAERLARALSVLRARRPTLGQPIVAGFSQGGMLSFELALHHPTSMALALPISGMLPPTLWPATRDARSPNPPIRALHGNRDTVVAYEPTARLVERLHALGFDATLQTFEGVGHAMPPDVQRSIEAILSEAVRDAETSH